MENKMSNKVNKPYLFSVLLLAIILPALSVCIDAFMHRVDFPLGLLGKWFIFWAIGVRLFTAGVRQVTKPGFTAETIFHIKGEESWVVVKELGFANICFGVMGITSLFIPHWRIVAACTGGLFFGIAGANHIIKKPAGSNEWIALASDIFVFVTALCYVIAHRVLFVIA
jgi:hypothetical protein